MIVKIQRPLNQQDGDVLIYDRSRKYEHTTPLTKAWREMFGDNYKIYCKAEMRGTIMEISDIVSDRDW